MSRDRRSRSRGRFSALSRRQALLLLGIGSFGGLAYAQGSGSYTSVTGDRISELGVAPEGDGIVGILPQDTVQFNQRDPLVEFENNYDATLDITISLDDSSDGELYDNDGNSGSTLLITIIPDGSQIIDIKAAVTGTIPYSIDSSASHFSLATSETTDAVTGYNAGAVDIRRPNKNQDFTTDVKKGRWEIQAIDVRDNDGDNDLDHIEVTIREGGSFGTEVATDTIDIKKNDSDRYAPGGSPDARIDPDDRSYNVSTGTLYNLEFRAYDADGNYAVESLEDQT